MSTAYGGNPTDLSGTHYGGYGLGVRGALIPSTGLHGPAIPYPGLSLPAEADDEFMCRILTVPPGLTSFNVAEDGSVQAEGPDGIYVGSWRGYKNGVAYGPDPSSFTFNIGGAGVVSGGATLDGLGASGALGIGAPSDLAGGATLDGPTAAGGLAGAPPEVSGGATLDGLGASGRIISGSLYAQQPETASSWSYLQTATLWPLTGRNDWTGASTYADPVWFLCDYAEESRRMTDATGQEFVARLLVYTSLPGIKQGDRVLIGAALESDPVVAGAVEVRTVTRWADTFNAEGAEDFRIAT